MKKGDERREAILDAAERLFYDKGYENTSVQDVLDKLSLSKGGFYHHFESKLKLLEAICARRSERAYRQSEAAVEACTGNAVAKLNAVLSRIAFFESDSVDYIVIMLQVVYRDGCVQLRDALSRMTLERYQNLITRIIHEGVDQKLFYTPFPDGMGRIILMLNNALTDETACLLSQMIRDADQTGALLELLEAYRYSVETLLNAPHGSIEIFDLQSIVDLAGRLCAYAEQ